MSNTDETPPVGLQDFYGGSQERTTVMLAAFEGWNDAGEAASDAVRFLSMFWQSERIASLNADEYYDFQFTRPVIERLS